MLYCVASLALTEERGVFFSDSQQLLPGVQAAVLTLPPPDSLHFLLGKKRVVGVLAKYAFHVLRIFDEVEVYLHPELLWPTGLSL